MAGKLRHCYLVCCSENVISVRHNKCSCLVYAIDIGNVPIYSIHCNGHIDFYLLDVLLSVHWCYTQLFQVNVQRNGCENHFLPNDWENEKNGWRLQGNDYIHLESYRVSARCLRFIFGYSINFSNNRNFFWRIFQLVANISSGVIFWQLVINVILLASGTYHLDQVLFFHV